jgi:pimeloyl-ACP methyl ester carboxylesterase
MSFQNPVIVIPGITATSLVDHYPVQGDRVWSMVFDKEYERVALHPDDLRYEAIEPAHVLAGQLIPVYDDLIRALRHELSSRADQPTPVFAFPYDWRMDIRLTAIKLKGFVDEVIARSRLLRHYAAADDLKVDLVGHSMGGLVICEYLSRFGRGALAGKVATIGTPYLGSVEAIVKIATGMSLLTGSEPKERERESARVTPALYQLFPSYPGATVGADGRDINIYDPRNMQASIEDSLTEFVRLYSVDTKAAKRRAKAAQMLRGMLDRALEHRQTMMKFRTAMAATTQADWLVIIGVGQRTRLKLAVTRDRRGPRFVIDEDQFVNELDAGRPDSQLTGDGTVALAGAMPPFLPATKPVCVIESDLGLFELRDRLLVEVGGFHGLLPRINLVQRLVTKHLLPSYRGDVWGRRLPGSPSWNPPIDGLAEKSY